jgi:hypothetical protein
MCVSYTTRNALATRREQQQCAGTTMWRTSSGAHSSRTPYPISAMESRAMLSRAPSSTVNGLWGLFNLAVGYLLVCRVGCFNLRKTQHVLVLGGGILLMSSLAAHTFGRFHGGAVNLSPGRSDSADLVVVLCLVVANRVRRRIELIDFQYILKFTSNVTIAGNGWPFKDAGLQLHDSRVCRACSFRLYGKPREMRTAVAFPSLPIIASIIR